MLDTYVPTYEPGHPSTCNIYYLTVVTTTYHLLQLLDLLLLPQAEDYISYDNYDSRNFLSLFFFLFSSLLLLLLLLFPPAGYLQVAEQIATCYFRMSAY